MIAFHSEEDVRRAWKEAHLAPLWESPTAHKPPSPPDPAVHWSWTRIRPLLVEAMKVTSPSAVERRVLTLVNATPRYAEEEATVRTLTAAMQTLLPNERARPHRHTMNALRFVLEGEGGVTVVDGKECPMELGDLILTPAWTWHEHLHRGTDPVIWLDVLDVPLHLWLGTAAFQPGPVNEAPATVPDAAFAFANVVPVTGHGQPHSPVFRYPYAQAAAAVAAAPYDRDGARRVRYANPLTGGSSMSLLDTTLFQLEHGRSTSGFRTNSNAVCCVAEGEGETIVGESTIAWRAKDVFSIPQHNWVRHRSLAPVSRLLSVSDRDAMQRLGLLKEEYAGAEEQ
jgi:gentisate 1,2-dioxygenase